MPFPLQNIIPPERAFLHAHTFLEFTKRSSTVVPQGFENLPSWSVNNTPILIQDVTESPLVYDFPVMLNQQLVGSVRVAAITSLGHPWISIGLKPPIDVRDIEQQARTLAGIMLPQHQFVEAKAVAFNFPRIGLLVRLASAGTAEELFLFDPEFPLNGLQEVREGTAAPEIEGTAFWSVLSNLPEGGHGESSPLLTHADSLVSGLIETGNLTKRQPFSPEESLEFINVALGDQPEGGLPVERIVNPQPAVIRQEASDFCVLASIDMLLRHHGIQSPADQSEIRAKLVEEPVLYSQGGVFPSRQIEAFERCFPDGYTISKDTSPEWTEAVPRINDNHPFKSGVFGHSRVCIGYRQASITSGPGNAVSENQRCLWINDPDRDDIKFELFERQAEGEEWRPAIPIKTNYFFVTPP